MTRSIKRGIPWPSQREKTKETGPFPPWEVFREKTLKNHFPDSTLTIEPEDEQIFEEYYIARRKYQKREPKANEIMEAWRKGVESKYGNEFYSRYSKVIAAIVQETTSSSPGKEIKR